MMLSVSQNSELSDLFIANFDEHLSPDELTYNASSLINLVECMNIEHEPKRSKEHREILS